MITITVFKLMLVILAVALAGFFAGDWFWYKFLYGKIDMSAH